MCAQTDADGWQSGWMQRSWKPSRICVLREFESHSIRHQDSKRLRPFIFCLYTRYNTPNQSSHQLPHLINIIPDKAATEAYPTLQCPGPAPYMTPIQAKPLLSTLTCTGNTKPQALQTELTSSQLRLPDKTTLWHRMQTKFLDKLLNQPIR